MKQWVLSVLIVLISIASIAQNDKGIGKISGKVLDGTTNVPLEYATISAIDEASGKTVTGTTTGKDGVFSITEIAAGNYKLVIEFIGYQQNEIKGILVRKNETTDVKKVVLNKTQQTLSTVTVTAQAKLVENKIDKMIFNAEKDITSVGGVATDVLKKVPQVSVDVDGNVQLAGNSSIRFLINGKPSTAFGSSISDVLQSIPASQIKSIEVITNPGAKYDAQGLGGIINIILKTSTAKGINGNLSMTAGTRMENGSFNFNARNKNFGFNAFVSGNARLKVETPYSNTRYSTDTLNKLNAVLNQNGTTNLTRHGIETGMGVDWVYKKYNNFSASVNYNVFGSNNGGLVNQAQQVSDYGGNVLSTILSKNNTANKNRFNNVDLAFNYKRTFAKEDQELEFSVNSSLGRSTIDASNEQFLQPKDSLYYGIQSTNPGRENETQIALDYTQPLAEKIIFGAGVKTTLLDITSASDVLGYNPDVKQYLYDQSLSINLNYHQQVYGGYAELTFPVSNWFDVKAGTRYERTEINSYYSNAQQNVKTPGYNTLVPSLFFSKKLGQGQVVKLSYAKRIERPDYGDLNPFINTSDPKNITAGNPYLKPEIGQRIELSYSKDFGHVGSVMVTAFIRHNEHDIQPYIKYYSSLQVGDSIYYNTSVSTRENIGTENNTGANIFADVHITPKLGLRGNVFFFYRHIINTIDAGGDRTSFNYRTNLNATYQFNSTFAAEFFGNFNSARNEVQGKYPSITTYSFAFRKLFWNKKGSLALTATNPFNEYVTQRTQLYGPNFITYATRKIPFRSVGINFTWKFGLLEFKSERESSNGDNMQMN